VIVGVDMRAVYQPVRRGTGKNLLDLYSTAARLRPDWRFVMFHRGQGNDDPFATFDNVEACAMDMPGDRWGLWQRLLLALTARTRKLDVLHCPANTAPRSPGRPMVLTIHDLIPLDPRFATEDADRWRRAVARAARTARRIIAPSEFTRENVINQLQVTSDKVVVNNWAPDRSCRKVTDGAQLLAARGRYGLAEDKPYVFGFGAADPRKNTAGILAAWALLPEAVRQSHQLLLVGIAETAMDAFVRQRRELDIEDSCILHGFADEADVAALLTAAEVLCYPSLSEGFGLPILDAFVCETAVLTSNTTSMPEVAGDAAVLVDPAEPASIAAGLAGLLTDAPARAALVARGRQRVASFTWEACAERLCAVVEAAAGNTGHER